MDPFFLHGYSSLMLQARTRDTNRRTSSSMRDCMMQSGSCMKARSRIQRAVLEGRVYTFLADTDMISRLKSGDQLSSLEDLGGGNRGNIPGPVNCAEIRGLGYDEESVKNAQSITCRALAELEEYEHQGEHFVLIREIPEAPVFHHLALRYVHDGSRIDTPMIAEGPVLFFGLFLFDAMHYDMLSGEGSMFRI